ncbi:ArsR family transcriptional regulator [Larkinella soli]|uniref:ArsR family transcriptional regulator n=1 Tax=Larkinella soli TaxID=1770527 RepID=UPI000FFC8308|nr:ArsR family transcriptional regulator [Larkinella soli]
MLETLITSKTRLKLLLKFFLNGKNESYLRGLEAEFGESSNAIRIELNRFEEAGLLVSKTEGKRKIYQANSRHSIYNELHNLLIKFVGIDEIIEKVLRRIGDLKSAYVIGDFARGIDSQTIELILVGDKLNENYILNLVEKAQKMIKRDVRISILPPDDLEAYLRTHHHLLIWQGN